MDIQEQLKHEAIQLGLCQQWQDEWGTPDVDALCDKFIRGIDFCIKHDWPTIDYIRKTFDANDVARNGIYIESGTSKGQQDVVTMSNAEVHVYVPANGMCDIYARHNSKIYIHLGVNSFCYVSVYDNARVFVEEKQEGAKIKASHFGGHLIGNLFDRIHEKK